MSKKKTEYLYLTGLGILLFLLFAGAELLPYSATEINPDAIWLDPCREHILGTDSTGRDVLVRLLGGGRNSVVLAAMAEMAAFPVGTLLGYAGAGSGRHRRWVSGMDHIMDIWFAFPTIILALLLAGIAGPGWATILLVVIAAEIPVYYIYTKREVRRIQEELFIQVLREMGVSEGRIFIHHIWVHLLPLLLPRIIFNFATTIIFESTLSFIGIGIQPPVPSWGNMISAGMPFIKVHPTMILSASILFAVTTLLLFGLADSLGRRLGGRK